MTLSATPVAAVRQRRWSPTAGFALVGLVLVAFLAAAAAPSPLYVVYQAQWGFSAATLTVVFASYAVALLLALVTVGGVSDFVGRRPVLVAALALEAVAMVLFLVAGDVPVLIAARVVQGLATGTATGVASAALVDLAPASRPQLGPLLNSAGSTGGLAAGALGSGVLVQLLPGSPWVVFAVLLAVMVLLAVAALRLPDTVAPRPGAWASLRPRLAVPRAARGTFLAVLPLLVATWSMGALYLSLGPSIAGQLLGLHSHLVEAVVVAVFTGAGAVGAVAGRDAAPRRVMLVGAAALAVGTALIVVGTATASVPAYLVGTVVAGTGFGGGFLGAFRSLAVLAEPEQRAELLATVYLVNYLAFSVPAVVAGLLVSSLGLRTTALGYGAIVVALALSVLLTQAVRRRRA